MVIFPLRKRVLDYYKVDTDEFTLSGKKRLSAQPVDKPFDDCMSLKIKPPFSDTLGG
jgi:hypothetical protein